MKSLISMLLWGVIWVYALIGIVGLLCVCVVTGPFAVIIVVIQLGLGAFGWAMSHRRGRGGAGFLLGFALGSIGVFLAFALPSAPGYYPVRLPPICWKCYERIAPAATRCPRCDVPQAIDPGTY